jgi:hypothetical protein
VSEDQERRAHELGKNEPMDVEGHAFDLGRAEAGDAEEERRENDEPEVEGHAFELGRTELGRSELGRTELGRHEDA